MNHVHALPGQHGGQVQDGGPVAVGPPGRHHLETLQAGGGGRSVVGVDHADHDGVAPVPAPAPVVAAPVADWLGVEAGKGGRIEVAHDLTLSYTARIGTLLVGSLRLSPVRIGEAPALLLGPLTIEPPFRDRGIGMALMQRALGDARERGHKLVILVGDEPYYARVGFKRIKPRARVKMPGPVDPARLLVCELVPGAFEGVAGAIRPDWPEG